MRTSTACYVITMPWLIHRSLWAQAVTRGGGSSCVRRLDVVLRLGLGLDSADLRSYRLLFTASMCSPCRQKPASVCGWGCTQSLTVNMPPSAFSHMRSYVRPSSMYEPLGLKTTVWPASTRRCTDMRGLDTSQI